MRPQIDLRPSRVMLALGAAGLGGACVTTSPADADAASSHAAAAAPGGALLIGGLPQVDRLGLAPGGALAPLIAAPAARLPGVAIWASTSRRNVLVGRRISVFGALRPVAQSRVLALQELIGRRWTTLARGATGRSGHYRLGFTPPAPGSLSLRVRFGGDRSSRPATGALGVVNVYRRAGASWYGGGGPLACGGSLTASRLGVANRTLPCGTMVSLRVGNRTVRVPVIDRGPYVAGRDYDLTPATRRALGFGDTGDVWATR